MSEVYIDKNSILDFPTTFDYSLDLKQCSQLFCKKSKTFQRSVLNSYLFSFKDDWLCVVNAGSSFRCVGRVISRFFPYVERAADYDTFVRGDLAPCVAKFSNIVYELCKSDISTLW